MVELNAQNEKVEQEILLKEKGKAFKEQERVEKERYEQ